jgi:hypothetical protein
MLVGLLLVACLQGEVLKVEVAQSPTMSEVDGALIGSGLNPQKAFGIGSSTAKDVGADFAASRVYGEKQSIDIYIFMHDSPERQAALTKWRATVRSGDCCDMAELGMTVVLVVGDAQFSNRRP